MPMYFTSRNLKLREFRTLKEAVEHLGAGMAPGEKLFEKTNGDDDPSVVACSNGRHVIMTQSLYDCVNRRWL